MRDKSTFSSTFVEVDSIAVVIPTYNNLPELRLCLKALSQQTFRDFVAYVCVDGSTDGTVEYLQRRPYEFVQVLIHPDGRNYGRNAARNLVLPYLPHHKWVAFLDSDCIPLPNWLESFHTTSENDQEVLLGQIIYYAPYGPNPWNEYRLWRARAHIRNSYKLNFRHFCTNVFFSAQAFREVGGFDASIRRHGLGDVELGWRLAQRGMKFRLVPEAKVWSASQHTPTEALLRYYEMGRINLPYLYQKHPGIQAHLYGGRWLTKPFYKFLIKGLYLALPPRWVYRGLTRMPVWLQVRFLHYLVLHAILWGYERRRLPTFLQQPLHQSK